MDKTGHFIKRARIKHGDRYRYDKTVYIRNRKKVIITCKTHGDFEQLPDAHILLGQDCPKCKGNNKYTNESFIKRAKEVHGNKYNYDNIHYVNNSTKVELSCNIHGIFKQTAIGHINMEQGCPKCGKLAMAKTQSLSKEKFVKNAIGIHGNLYDYSNVIYVSNKIPVIIICKKHGEFNQRPDNHIGAKAGCPICNESKGEKRIKDFLINNNIKYVKEYRLPNSKYRYDFYLTDLDVLIEYDGKQHYKPIETWGGLTSFNKTKEHDKQKDMLAIVNKLCLIRIPYTSFKKLELVLINKLSRLYKYKVNDKFYRNFIELCNNLKLPRSTRPQDVKQHLTFKILNGPS